MAKVRQLKFGNELQELAVRASPKVQQALDKLDVATQQILEKRRDSQPQPDVVPAGLDQVTPARGLGLAAIVDVTLHLGFMVLLVAGLLVAARRPLPGGQAGA